MAIRHSYATIFLGLNAIAAKNRETWTFIALSQKCNMIWSATRMCFPRGPQIGGHYTSNEPPRRFWSESVRPGGNQVPRRKLSSKRDGGVFSYRFVEIRGGRGKAAWLSKGISGSWKGEIAEVIARFRTVDMRGVLADVVRGMWESVEG